MHIINFIDNKNLSNSQQHRSSKPMQEQPQKCNARIVVIGGGLSGLTAAEHIMKASPNCDVTVLEAMEQVGGRTCSKVINGAKFDLGGTWVGRTQKYTQQLAERANNQLIPQYHTGAKILDISNKVSTYNSNIPFVVGIVGLLHMQATIWKLDRMANKLDPVNPRNYKLSMTWDSLTVRAWMEKNIHFLKIKILIECAVRAVIGAETDQISMLFFLWYIRQNGGIDNLINIQNGLQQKKMIKGAQHLSIYLKGEIQKLKGRVITSCHVSKITLNENQYTIQTQTSQKYKADYVIIAMPPARVNKIVFEPQLSRERRYMNQRNMMGSISKVLLLYDRAYWRENGYSGETLSDCLTTPIFNAYDETRTKENGEIQPAIVVFINGSVDREWSHNRQAAEKNILETLASYFRCQQMLNPLSVNWKVWNQQKPVNGGPVAYFPPGVLTKIGNIRVPEGKIYWAGTEMARQSQGFMDGAIESGLRAADEVLQNIKISQKQSQQPLTMQGPTPKSGSSAPTSAWYKKIVNTPKKWIQWL